MADPKSESATPKRSASPLEPDEAKRTRIEQQSEPSSESQSPAPHVNGVENIELEPAVESFALTQHYQTRCAIQRSIALVLKHDGFESATPDAMESFTALVESCKD
jgi:transcription initiation factor TFIID subunit 8